MILKYTKSEDLRQTCAFCIKYLPWVKEFQNNTKYGSKLYGAIPST